MTCQPLYKFCKIVSTTNSIEEWIHSSLMSFLEKYIIFKLSSTFIEFSDIPYLTKLMKYYIKQVFIINLRYIHSYISNECHEPTWWKRTWLSTDYFLWYVNQHGCISKMIEWFSAASYPFFLGRIVFFFSNRYHPKLNSLATSDI